MFVCQPTVNPIGACSITADVVLRLKALDWLSIGISVPPVIQSQLGRPNSDTPFWITVVLNPAGRPIRHGNSNVFDSSIRITAWGETESGVLDVINFAHSNLDGSSSTKYEEYCIVRDLPVSKKIFDGVWTGVVSMPVRILRSRI